MPVSKWHKAEIDQASFREGVQRCVPFKVASNTTVNDEPHSFIADGSPRVGSLCVESSNSNSFIAEEKSGENVNAFCVDGELRRESSMSTNFELPCRIFGRRDRNVSVISRERSDVVPLRVATNLFTTPGQYRDAKKLLPESAELAQPTGINSTTAVNNKHIGKTIEEGEFFSDILFMWMGVDKTKYFTYDEKLFVYVFNADWGNLRQQQTLNTLQECGCLARRIYEVLKNGQRERSFLQQSLRSAVRRQLSQYHCLIASFRERRLPSLVFADLIVAYKRVEPKLRVLYTILCETESVKGGKLVSKLQLLIQQGSSRLSTLLSDIYMETVSPLLYMTVSSITKGLICDPFNEFFVKSNSKIEDLSDEFWSSKFSLLPEMLPTTVPRLLAEQIMLVIKNISFIKNCCRCKEWDMDSTIISAAQNASFDTIGTVVYNAMEFTNKEVMKLIHHKFNLNNVLKLVDAFLLVGNGGFYELLIDKLDPILSRLSHLVQTSIVRDYMQSALLDIIPFTKHLDTDLFPILHCELVKDNKVIGWDAFIVTMSLPSPLNNIFDLTAMKIYKRLFRMIFKVKRAEVALKKSWRQNVMLDRIIISRLSNNNNKEEITAWRELAADSHLLGLQLNHFVNNLWSYFVAEVCTISWDLFMRALRQCQSLDDIRTAHITFLQYLTLHSLLHGDCTLIRQNIENILAIVRQFVGVQSLLTSLLERGSGDLFLIKNEYQRLNDDFQREISSLLTTLEEQNLQFDFLNFLILRLNFNYFYHDTAFATNTEF